MFSQNQNTIVWTTDSEFMPQNSVKSIAPDKYGFIWMTTEKGLVRYDGTNFKIYDSHSLSLHNDRFVFIRGNSARDSLFTFTDMLEDYVLISKRSAVNLDPLSNQESPIHNKKKSYFLHSYGLPTIYADVKNIPYRIELDSGNYYLLQNDAVRLYDKKNTLQKYLRFESTSNANFFAIGEILFYLDKDGRYAKIQNGTSTWQQLEIASNRKSQIFWNVVARQVFYYSDKKLYQLSYESGKLNPKLFIDNENLIEQDVASIYYDNLSQKIFLGSKKKGLGIVTLKPFNTLAPLQTNESESSEIFYALHHFSDTTTLSATGFLMNKNKIIKNLNFKFGRYDIAIDQNNDIWMSQFNNLYRYRKNKKYQSPEKWIFDDYISTLYKAKNEVIWFDIAHNKDSSGSLYFFKTAENPNIKKFLSLPFKVNYITQTDTISLWLGSKKGLYRLIIDSKKLISIPQTKNLNIRNIYVSDKDNIWLTTYESGFFLLRKNRLYSFPTDRRNYLQSSHCIVESNGFFWITTNKGLFQVSKNNLMAYVKNKTEIYYHYYNKDYGFLSNEFNGGCQPCGVKLKNGDIFFPSMNGVVTFNPKDIVPTLPQFDIFVDEAVVDDSIVNIKNDTISLNRNFERVTFSITSPYYGNQNNQNFEAQLEGPETQEWIYVRRDNLISFTNLVPGRYTLTIRKLSGFNSTYVYKKVIIIVEPALWQTTWFRMFMLFITLAVVFISFHSRLKYIRNRNTLLEKTVNEKTSDLKDTISALRNTKDQLSRQIENNIKIIQYITHDIKSPLKFIAMASKHMYDTYDENPYTKDNINSIYTSSTQIFNFVTNLLEYSKVNFSSENLEVSTFELRKVVQEKAALFEGIGRSQKTVIKNLIPKDSYLKTNQQLFAIIIHNLLDNAVKNTHQGMIVFSIRNEEGTTFLKIADTGYGMSENTLRYYQSLAENYSLDQPRKPAKMGLQIVLELLLILNGKIKFESSTNGTVVTLKFSDQNN